MVSTKEEERKALVEIEKILASLGENSYLAAAFAGCSGMAEMNMLEDSLNNFPDKVKKLTGENEKLEERLKAEQKKAAENQSTIDQLKKQLEKEQEWMPSNTGFEHYNEKDYQFLKNQSDTKILSDEEAKEMIQDELGFSSERIHIRHQKTVYEVNRHRQLRKVEKVERDPMYNATDWNYIRFECGFRTYEYCNGELHFDFYNEDDE